ncbi:MAG TPA: gamma-glutamyl-gamma-aminobutyrate hydrolase family protein [Rhodopila sp.]|jgi:putative glutamine amidotransferase|nr:gamma-glutamyl-gamma-aminobutyrate hydrolase family protein [Rhodopila sp.]
MIVGIPACAKILKNVPFHQTPARYAQAVLHGAGALPIMIPPLGEAMLDLLDTVSGLLIPGSPSNVHPSHYDGGESETPDLHDLERDGTTLPLIRAAVRKGIPVLAICRGIQELNVALGGTLIQRVHVRDGRHDHRAGDGPLEKRYGPKHPIAVSGSLARILGVTMIQVNSLHGQALDRLAPGLVVEATAPDGTIEAVAMPSAPGWLLGVQWHPEWAFADNPHSVAIFAAFGDACRQRELVSRKAA